MIPNGLRPYVFGLVTSLAFTFGAIDLKAQPVGQTAPIGERVDVHSATTIRFVPPAPALDPHTTLTNTTPVTITGSVEGAVQVKVSGPGGVFMVPVSGGVFSADVPLVENRINRLFFTAISQRGGRSAPAATAITHDADPPTLFIDFPPAGAELTTADTDVAGRVADMLSGFMGLTVTVNGIPAVVDVGIGTNGTFLAKKVPLTLGQPTVLEATAFDFLENFVTEQITVTRVEISPEAPRMEMGSPSGNRQTASTGTVLPLPLLVRMTHADMTPFPNKIVTFDVNRSDGLLAETAPGQGTMMLQVRTDADGFARAFWRLGSDAGCGNNRVAVTSRDIAGTVFFCASATSAAASLINIGTGNNQRAEAGGPAARPLTVWVSDGRNPVQDVPVMFTVVSGGGLVNGAGKTVVLTDRTGHAEVDFTLGPDRGNQRVEATFPGNPGPAAVFDVFALRRTNRLTSFSGLVLDNASRPIQGATCSLVLGGAALPPVESDLDGQFRFDHIPTSGDADLFVDGLTAFHVGGADGEPVDPGSFPTLHYKTVIVPNAENSLSTPALLPPLNHNNALEFDNTHDVELTVEGVEGLKMIVRAGSMMRADGSVPSQQDPAIISLNQVHFDKIPMPMPDGAAPPFAWTLQPAGAHFDPPVEIVLPNMVGLPPAAVMYFLSFNHDTDQFEIVSSGHVTEDGLCMVTDPGDGISTAGWGGFCPPYPNRGSIRKGMDIDPGDPVGPDEEPPCVASRGSNVADPIYLFSGEFHLSVEDLRIRGRGTDFVWARKYRSKTGPDTAQGNGWDCSYNISIEALGDDIVVRDGNTREDLYRRQPDDSFARSGFFRRLIENPDGTYTLRFADQETWIFDALDGMPQAGKLIGVVDRNGNRLSYAYDALGRLETVTDTLDRDIQIAYNADGFIESVTDFAGRQVRYEYYGPNDPDGSPGDLRSVTTPIVENTPDFPIPPGHEYLKGKTTVYTYTKDFADDRLNHNLLTVTDPKEQLYVQNTYAATQDPNELNFDRVVRQEWGNPGDIIDFEYVEQLPTPQNNFAVVKTIVNDRVGDVKEFFYDERHNEVIVREYTGRADPDLPTTETDNRPSGRLRPDDPDFFETRYEWNKQFLQTRVIYPNGNIVVNLYQSDLDRSAPPRTRGNLIARVRLPGTHDVPGDQDAIVEMFEYDTDFNGCCGSNFVTEHIDGRGNVTLNDFDAAGNRTRTIHRIPSIVEDFEYNEFGQMTAHVLPDNGSGHRRRDEYTYYETGPQRGYRQSEIIDAGGFGLTTEYNYNLVGVVNRVTDPRGHDTDYVINQLDQGVLERSRAVELPRGKGNFVRYERETFYDPNDNVVRRDVQNYDDQGVLPNSDFTTIYEYEILNHLIRMCAEVGSYTGPIPGTPEVPICEGLPASKFLTTEYEYDANRNRTLVRYGEAVENRQPDNVVETLHDERDLVFQVIRAPGVPGPGGQSTTQFDYDKNKNVVATLEGIELEPHTTTYVYDGYDRLVDTIDPMSNVMTYRYDENHNRVSEHREGELIDVPGNAAAVRLTETAYVYDALDRLIRTEIEFFETESGTPIGDGQSIMQTIYSDNSQVIRTVNDNDHQTLTAFDTANRPRIIADHKDNTIEYGYDANSNVITVTETETSDLGAPNEVFVTTIAYDSLDRQISGTDNVGNVNQYFYDSRNNRTKTVDALGNVVRDAYDGINRLTETVREITDGTITTRQTWDDTSRLTRQTDDNANTTTYVYDPLDRKIAETYADTTEHTYLYDVHDNQIEITDANGSIATGTYDLLDRLTRKDIVPGPGVSNDTTFEVYKYDGLSRLAHAEDDDSLVLRSYDSTSNVTSEVLNAQTTASVYDGVRNLTFCRYPGGREITTTFDELERKKTISDQNGLIARYDYVGPRRVARREYGNNTRTEYTYDGITGISNPPGDFAVKKIVRTRHTHIATANVIDERTYTWDRMYNKTQRKDVRATGPQLTHDYAYDSVYRLNHTVVTDALGAVIRDQQYGLDGVGNRTTVVGGPNPGKYTMDPTLPEPADRQVNQYTTTSSDTRRYDRNGNLIRIDDGLPTQRTLLYDYRSQFVQHTDDAGVISQYGYDALGRRIERVVDDGAAETTRYFYYDWRVCEEQDENGTTQATYAYGLYVDEVLDMRRDGTAFYYHTDDLYDVMKATDASGAVAEGYEYEDFGSPIIFDANGNAIPESSIENAYLFTGRRYDVETAWYYFRTRYLDPIPGRFTTRDTIGIWGDRINRGNAFAYVNNSPETLLDPSGELWSFFEWNRKVPPDRKLGLKPPPDLRKSELKWPHEGSRFMRGLVKLPGPLGRIFEAWSPFHDPLGRRIDNSIGKIPLIGKPIAGVLNARGGFLTQPLGLAYGVVETTAAALLNPFEALGSLLNPFEALGFGRSGCR